jgi:hypothetical protein
VYLFKKKKLTLREVHKLYLLLKPFLPEKEEDYLIYEVIKILEKITPDTMKAAMDIYYNKDFAFKETPTQIALMFSGVIKDSGLFAYIQFIERLK